MCGASEQCRLAPLVRAGVMMHSRTWGSAQDPGIEQNFFNEFQGFQIDQAPDGYDPSAFLAYFKVARAFPRGNRLELIQNSQQFTMDQVQAHAELGLVERANKLTKFAANQHANGNSYNIALSGHSKIHTFFCMKHWCIFDRNARNALSIGKHEAAFSLFYIRLDDMEFPCLCDQMRTVILGSPLDNLWPERIIDKMLWIMGDTDPCEHLRFHPNDLALRVGPPLADHLNQLTAALCPIICRSPLGQHLLQRLDEMCHAP